MPPKPCKAGVHNARSGRNYKGLGPVGCKIQVGLGNQAVKPRTAAQSNTVAGDTVTVAKQRNADNPGGCGNAAENRVLRDVRITYTRPTDPPGTLHVVSVPCATLDTGAQSDLYIGFDAVYSLFPGRGMHDKWAKLTSNLPYGTIWRSTW
jgi:hypothetical protein